MVTEEAPPGPRLRTVALSENGSPGPTTFGFADTVVTTRSDAAAVSCTVTPNLCVAERLPGSRAVTVIVAVPAAAPVTVSVEPDNATVAVAGLDELALKRRFCPSGSVKYEDTLIESVSSIPSERSPTLPTARGGRLP